MGAFSSNKFINTTLKDFDGVVSQAEDYFTAQGFEIGHDDSATGYCFSLSKGGMFKAVLGMKTALNVSLSPMDNGVTVNAEVGIFGQQLIPSLISAFVFWPVLLTQIAGMVKQANLDDEVITFIEQAIRQRDPQAAAGAAPTAGKAAGGSFCTKCGGSIPAGAGFCPGCGAKVE